MVSHMVSHFIEDVISDELKPIQGPPSIIKAASKDSLVLVDGSKKQVAKILPFSRLGSCFFFMAFALFKIVRISSLEKSAIETISCLKSCLFLSKPIFQVLSLYFKNYLVRGNKIP